jgi:hypothetical protein
VRGSGSSWSEGGAKEGGKKRNEEREKERQEEWNEKRKGQRSTCKEQKSRHIRIVSK